MNIRITYAKGFFQKLSMFIEEQRAVDLIKQQNTKIEPEQPAEEPPQITKISAKPVQKEFQSRFPFNFQGISRDIKIRKDHSEDLRNIQREISKSKSSLVEMTSRVDPYLSQAQAKVNDLESKYRAQDLRNSTL